MSIEYTLNVFYLNLKKIIELKKNSYFKWKMYCIFFNVCQMIIICCVIEKRILNNFINDLVKNCVILSSKKLMIFEGYNNILN
jgi:hypothetical protein